MPTYRHGDNSGYGAVNAAMGAQFARNGGLIGIFSKDPAKEAQLRQIAAEIQLQKIRGEQDVTLEQTRGSETRLTAAQGAKLGLDRAAVDSINAILLENTKSNNTIKEKRAQGEIDTGLHKTSADNAIRVNRDDKAGRVLAEDKIIQDPQTTNEKVYSQSLTDPTIRMRAGGLKDTLDSQSLMRGIRATPEGQNAQIANFLAGQYAPAFANYKMGHTDAGPGSVSMPPEGSGIELPRPDLPNAVRGALISQSNGSGGVDQFGMQRPDKVLAAQRFPIDMSGLPEAGAPSIPAPMPIPRPMPSAVQPAPGSKSVFIPPRASVQPSPLLSPTMPASFGMPALPPSNLPGGPSPVSAVMPQQNNYPGAMQNIPADAQKIIMYLVEQLKNAKMPQMPQIPDPFKHLQIPDPFAQ